MNEQTLRNWVREVMGRDVSWVEPSFGSSVGKPDAEFNINGWLLPVELKWWEVSSLGHIKHKMRPAQIRYHVMAAQRGMKTAIMFAHDLGDGFVVNMISGKNCPRKPNGKIKYDPIASNDDDHGFARSKIEALVSSKEFWE